MGTGNDDPLRPVVTVRYGATKRTTERIEDQFIKNRFIFVLVHRVGFRNVPKRRRFVNDESCLNRLDSRRYPTIAVLRARPV
jgi:hypothetical protein